MLLKTQGIVLKAIKYGESSVICDIYTKELGLHSFIMGGVRGAKSRVGTSIFQLLSLVELVAYYRESKDLHRIKEIKPYYYFSKMPFEVLRGTTGLFLAEVIRQSIKEQEQNLDLYAFLEESIAALDGLPSMTLFPSSFMLQLSRHIGFLPENNHHPNQFPFFDLKAGSFKAEASQLCLEGRVAHALSLLLTYEYKDLASLDINKANRRALLDGLVVYYQHHLEYFKGLNSLEVLRECL